jgi:protein-S-isoprenylcysteine O-methyltransferase Ste14
MADSINIESNSIDLNKLKKTIYKRLFSLIFLLGLLFFLPAGTFNFWEAWLYMSILIIPMLFVIKYLLKNDPALLERRMRMKEKESEQKIIIKLFSLFFISAYLIPGFDYRFDWSTIPMPVIIIADITVFVGYMLFVSVLKENTYASRIIEVEETQSVIETGPYSIVRHPMYSALLLMYSISPIALGSYWAMIPTVLLPVLIIVRIINEEKVLIEELEGYEQYIQKVKYRIIPGIW